MAKPQRLKLTLRNRENGKVWKFQPLTIVADPEDIEPLQRRVVEMARDLDSRGSGEAWWADQYAAQVQGLDQTWRDFEVFGGGA